MRVNITKYDQMFINVLLYFICLDDAILEERFWNIYDISG